MMIRETRTHTADTGTLPLSGAGGCAAQRMIYRNGAGMIVLRALGHDGIQPRDEEAAVVDREGVQSWYGEKPGRSKDAEALFGVFEKNTRMIRMRSMN
eukprot:891278-Rhodomonas_salina.1